MKQLVADEFTEQPRTENFHSISAEVRKEDILCQVLLYHINNSLYTKADTLKQEFSQHGHVCPCFE